MSSHTQWRRFQFFEKTWTNGSGKAKSLCESLRLPSDIKGPPPIVPAAAAFLPAVARDNLQKGSNKRTGILFFGDEEGCIHLADEDAQPLTRFRAFRGGVFFLEIAAEEPWLPSSCDIASPCFSPRRGPFLVCLGSEPTTQLGNKPPLTKIKIWHIDTLMDALRGDCKESSSVLHPSGSINFTEGERKLSTVTEVCEPTPLSIISLPLRSLAAMKREDLSAVEPTTSGVSNAGSLSVAQQSSAENVTLSKDITFLDDEMSYDRNMKDASFFDVDEPTAFAVTKAANQIAIGFLSGCILLYCGDFCNRQAHLRKPYTLKTPLPFGFKSYDIKSNSIFPSVTSLHFAEHSQAQPYANGRGDRITFNKGAALTSGDSIADSCGNSETSLRLFVTTQIWMPSNVHAVAGMCKNGLASVGHDREDTKKKEHHDTPMGGRGTGVVVSFDVSAIIQLQTESHDALNHDTQVVATSSSPEHEETRVYSGPSKPPSMIVLDDEKGGALNCATYDPAKNELDVGRTDAVYSFTPDDRGGAAGFEGRKQALVNLLPGGNTTCSSLCGGSNVINCRRPGYLVVASHNDKSSRSEINIYDMSNKFVAFNHRLDARRDIVNLFTGIDSGTVFVITSPNSLGSAISSDFADTRDLKSSALDNRLHTPFAANPIKKSGVGFRSGLSLLRLNERPTTAKLDLLFKMNYYQHAILLAKTASYSEGEMNKMYLMYGDHKYKKCDWEGSIQQYCHTIGFTEPSYIIRKFLDAQRISYLTIYLERLHSVDDGLHASKEHTTLLLNCYTKLKKIHKLHWFVREFRAGRLTFDIETAVNVLRNAGYSKYALELVIGHTHPKRHEWFLETQLSFGTLLPPSSPSSLHLSLSSSQLEHKENQGKVTTEEAEQGGVAGDSSRPDYLNSASEQKYSLLRRSFVSPLLGFEENTPDLVVKQTTEALAYLGGLPPQDIEYLLQKYGKELLERLPEHSSGLIMKLCTDYDKEVRSDEIVEKSVLGMSSNNRKITRQEEIRDPANFVTLFVDRQSYLQLFLHKMFEENMRRSLQSSQSSNTAAVLMSAAIADTLLELLLCDWGKTYNKWTLKGLVYAAHSTHEANRDANIDPLSALPFTSITEAVASINSLDTAQNIKFRTCNSSNFCAAVAATATNARSSIEHVELEGRAQLMAKQNAIMTLLQRWDIAPVDRYYALVLVQVYHCETALLYLLEKFRKDCGDGVGGDEYSIINKGCSSSSSSIFPASYLADIGVVVADLLVDYFLFIESFDEVMRVCKMESYREARPNPSLWRRVLTHLVLRCQLASDQKEASRHNVTIISGSSVPISVCKNQEELGDAHEFLERFLSEIESEKVLPVLTVMETLALNPILPLSVASNFLLSFTMSRITEIENNRMQLIQVRRKNEKITESLKNTTETVNDKEYAGVRTFTGPSIASEAHKWVELKRSMVKGATDSEARFSELQHAAAENNGFSCIAKFYGEGMVQ